MAAITLHGPTAVIGGLALLGLAYLNWRYIEKVTRSTFNERVAERLARNPVGNRIGGTVFLAIVGILMIIGGSAQTFGK